MHFSCVQKMNKSTTFNLGSCITRNMSSGSPSFWGYRQSLSNKSTTCEARKIFESFQRKLDNLEHTPVRGQYTRDTWLLLLFCHGCGFHPRICHQENASFCTTKGYLNLPRCFTTSPLHHTNAIDISLLSEFRTKAKLSFLSSISTAKDLLIQDTSSPHSKEYAQIQKIPPVSRELHMKARSSINTITSTILRTKQAVQKG